MCSAGRKHSIGLVTYHSKFVTCLDIAYTGGENDTEMLNFGINVSTCLRATLPQFGDCENNYGLATYITLGFTVQFLYILVFFCFVVHNISVI